MSLSNNVIGGHKSHLTRISYGLRMEDLEVLAQTFDFADALEFEEFMHTQQAKAMARAKEEK